MTAVRSDGPGRKLLGALVWAALLSRASLLLGAPCPADRFASGAPEHLLAGIDAARGAFADLSRAYGPPTRRDVYVAPDGPPGSGQGEYVWEVGGADLKVATLLRAGERGKRMERITAISLTLARPQISRATGTGRGVRLGDTAKVVRRLYGKRFLKESVDSRLRMTYCFEDGTVLYLRFDDRGKVDEILLDVSGTTGGAGGGPGPSSLRYRRETPTTG